jgi:hypothetical protein
MTRKAIFEVTGCDSGKRYRMSHGTSMNIHEPAGRPHVGWCLAPKGHLVAGDVMLAQKIALEIDERGARSVANEFLVSTGRRNRFSITELWRNPKPMRFLCVARGSGKADSGTPHLRTSTSQPAGGLWCPGILWHVPRCLESGRRVPVFSKAEELRIWLEANELASLNDIFAENDLDLEVLPELTEADLRELGLSLGQRRRLMRALRQTASTANPTDAKSQASSHPSRPVF